MLRPERTASPDQLAGPRHQLAAPVSDSLHVILGTGNDPLQNGLPIGSALALFATAVIVLVAAAIAYRRLEICTDRAAQQTVRPISRQHRAVSTTPGAALQSVAGCRASDMTAALRTAGVMAGG